MSKLTKRTNPNYRKALLLVRNKVKWETFDLDWKRCYK